MAVWWMSEAVNITATALLPLGLFPVLGLLKPEQVAKAFFSDLSFLLMGSVCFSVAMSRWNLHKRFALRILTVMGENPSTVLFGFMFCTYFISWWLSNTATTVMMLPVAHAVLESINTHDHEDGKSVKMHLLRLIPEAQGDDIKRFSTAILLAVAYSAALGGLATLTGAGTNLVFAAQIRNLFPRYGEVSFAGWTAYAGPLTFILLIFMWVIFYIRFTRGNYIVIDGDVIKKKYDELGSLNFEEVATALLLLCTILLWIMRSPPGCTEHDGCGWVEIFSAYRPWYGGSQVVLISDATVVFFTALLLFFIPAKNAEPGTKLLSWAQAHQQIPWDILLLIGSGLALAEAYSANGFNAYIASHLSSLRTLPPYLFVLFICIMITVFTEFTSNTAVASITFPVIASTAVAIRVNPFLLLVPAVVSCSSAFCLPVSTPSNALVASSGGVKPSDMLRTGLWMNLLAIISNLSWLAAAGGILGIDPNTFPSWAEPLPSPN